MNLKSKSLKSKVTEVKAFGLSDFRLSTSKTRGFVC